MVNIYDGRRQLMPAGKQVLLTVTDGFQKQIIRNYYEESSIDLEFPVIYGNERDKYAIVAFIDGYVQAGFSPVRPIAGVHQTLNLMLIPKDGTFNFGQAKWADVQAHKPKLANVITNSLNGGDPAQFYGSLIENEAAPLACLLNITTAMEQIFLPQGTPLDYIAQIVPDDLHQDRFFGWARPAILNQLQQAVSQKEFEQEPSIDLGLHSDPKHGPATASFKQIQFGEANVQLTFHGDTKKEINGETCIMIEPDIDYYKDLGAHTILEVIPNALTGSLTDPKWVYVLRWIAGQRAGIPEFDPLYVIE